MKHRKTTTLLTSLLLIPMTQAQADNGSTERTVAANYRADYVFVRDQTDRPAGCDLLRHQCRDRHPSLAEIARSDRLLTQEIRVFEAEQTGAVTGAAGQSLGTNASSSQAPALPASSLAACIVQRESSGNPQDVSGQYSGLANWSPDAWAQDGGLRYGATPTAASPSEQMQVLDQALADGKGYQQWGEWDGC